HFSSSSPLKMAASIASPVRYSCLPHAHTTRLSNATDIPIWSARDRFSIIALPLNERAAPKDFCIFSDDSIRIKNRSVGYDHVRFSLSSLWNVGESEGTQASAFIEVAA